MNLSRLRRTAPARAHCGDAAPVDPGWWPWSPSAGGDTSCPESAIVFDALQRRLSVTGALRPCCAAKVSRVLDFAVVISPGDTSIDLAGVVVLDPVVAGVVREWTARMASRGYCLSVVGASPDVDRALADPVA